MQRDHDPLAEPAPASIGKYPVMRAIGQGATSRVYLAEDPFSAQRVAIKLVQRDPAACQVQFNQALLRMLVKRVERSARGR